VFVRRLTLIMVTVAVGAMFLTSCNGDDDQTSNNLTPGSRKTAARQSPIPGASPGTSITAEGTQPPTVRAGTSGPQRLSIDADPGNGSGPCDIVDDVRSVATGDEFDVAVCLGSADAAPIDGKLSTITIFVSYGTELTGVIKPGDGLNDLDSNPNFVQGPGMGGADWDCNVLDDPVAAPVAAPSPARITCTTVDLRPNSTASGTIALVTLTLRAASPGDATVAVGIGTSILADRYEALCGDNIECLSVRVTVR